MSNFDPGWRNVLMTQATSSGPIREVLGIHGGAGGPEQVSWRAVIFLKRD